MEYTTHAPLCGDKVKQTIEKCDDGNTENGDGCSEECEIEHGWTAVLKVNQTTAKLYTVGEPICGDGFLTSVEGCDEGFTQFGCENDCSEP